MLKRELVSAIVISLLLSVSLHVGLVTAVDKLEPEQKKSGSSLTYVSIVPKKTTQGKSTLPKGLKGYLKKKKKVVKECKNWYGGIGIHIDWDNKITDVIIGYPAYKHNLMVGDIIGSVDGNDIKGKPGTIVSVKVTRLGVPYIVNIVREKICTGD